MFDAYQVILDDVPSAVREMLKRNPALACITAEQDQLFEEKIFHWLYRGDTLLHLAAAGHREAIIKLLLAAGADVNACANRRRSRPLHYAADTHLDSLQALQQIKSIALLLEAGADLNAQDQNGATALHRATRTRGAAAVQFLLKQGADPYRRNLSGSTAFHLAVQNTGRGGSGTTAAKQAQLAIIEHFLKHGVDPTLPDGNGKSVLDLATSPAIRILLKKDH